MMNDSLVRMGQLLLLKSVRDELDLSRAQETDLSAALGEIRQKLAGEMEKALGEILTQEQYQRFQEIGIQARGLNVFGDAEVQSQLQLTDDQREQIRAILRDGFQEARTLRESLTGLQKRTMDKATAVLTDKQKAQWKQMHGQHFDFR